MVKDRKGTVVIMTVRDVMKKVTCAEPRTPVEIFSSAGKTHEEFEYRDFTSNRVQECYLNEEVDYYKQFEEVGAIQIFLKPKR